MKKLILTIAASAAFFVPATKAQGHLPEKAKPTIRKGTMTIGTDIGVANFAMAMISPSEKHLLYDIQLRPSVGYFVSDHLMLSASMFGGAAQSYGYFTEPVRINGTNIGMSVGGRYYIGKGITRQGEIKKLRFYGEAGIGVSQRWDKWTNTYSGDVSKSTEGYFFANLGAGMNYFLTPNVAFETGLSYNRFMPVNWSSIADATVQVNLGVRVFLHKK